MLVCQSGGGNQSANTLQRRMVQDGGMRPFRFWGVAAAGPVGPREIVDTARRAEAAGFAGLVLPDHLLKQHAPIPVLATVAAATQRLRILPFVLNTGLRHPAVVAQDLATLDVL